MLSKTGFNARSRDVVADPTETADAAASFQEADPAKHLCAIRDGAGLQQLHTDSDHIAIIRMGTSGNIYFDFGWFAAYGAPV